MADDRVRIEIGFDGGQMLAAFVELAAADELERALAQAGDGAFALEADDGRYTVSLRRVVYIKRFTREGARRLHPPVSGRACWAFPSGELERRSRRRRICAAWSNSPSRGTGKRWSRSTSCISSAIYSYLHMSVGNRHDAEDLTTQTFLKMLEAIGRFRWRARTLLRVALPHRAQPGDGPLPRHQALAARGGGAGARGSEQSSAEDEALQSIGRRSMLELIDDLSHDQQQVLTLKFVFNFSNGDAATILGKTEGAVKSLQHRALTSLQKQVTRD